MTWEHLGHVDPPPTDDGDRPLIFYLGPNHYPAGLYLPLGYDLEWRPGDEGWMVVRARDSDSRQILTLWAVRTDETAGERPVKILDP